MASDLSDNVDIHAGKSISSSYFVDYPTTFECICLKIMAALFPVMSHGLTQCFTPFAA